MLILGDNVVNLTRGDNALDKRDFDDSKVEPALSKMILTNNHETKDLRSPWSCQIAPSVMIPS
jgi:hypothetical protein